MKEEELVISSLRRFLKVGSLASRVGSSFIVSKIFEKLGTKFDKEKRIIEDTKKIVDALGKLKGGAMKIGQMLSLQDAIFPKEVTQLLSELQKDSPSVPFKNMLALLTRELKDNMNDIDYIDPVAYAAASIGQVHKGRLKDGTAVIFKIQYPNIVRIIKSDLVNLKIIFKTLFSLIYKVDLDTVWTEIEQKLLEEIDYEKELSNLQILTKNYQDNKKIIIPKAYPKYCTKRVMTMEFIEGFPENNLDSDEITQNDKNLWGETLYSFLLQGIFQDHYLHADPNLANFAFAPEGKIIVYDYGCTKEIPDFIANGMKKLIISILNDDINKIPSIFKEMKIYKHDGSLIEQEVIDPYLILLIEIFKSSPPYNFSNNDRVTKALLKLDKMNFQKSRDIVFPQDLVFINRTIAGHFGNLGKLKACANWNKLLNTYLKSK